MVNLVPGDLNLNNLIKRIEELEKANTTKDNSALTKTKNLKTLKSEIKSWFTINSYSHLLDTHSCFYKLFWFGIFVLSNLILVYLASNNILLYLQYEFISKSTLITEQDQLTFPAFNLCPTAPEEVLTYDETVINCTFNGEMCSRDSFRESPLQKGKVCLQFNSGRLSINDTKILKTTRTGVENGLQLNLFTSKNYFFEINIDDNYVLPVEREFEWYAYSGNLMLLKMFRTEYEKLEEPHNHCVKKINEVEYPILKEMNSNFTYRKINCLEVCKNLPGTNNCNSLCPLECDTINFVISSQNFFISNLYETVQIDFDYMKKRVNRENLTDTQIAERLTTIFVFYTKLAYEKNTQNAKTSISDLISNLGGLIGLFIELSFISFFRSFEFILKIIF